MARRAKLRPRSSERLGSDAWIAAAREALIRGGVARVKVAALAATLGVTSGSFYWHFKDRPALLDTLLADWEGQNTTPMIEAVAAHPESPVRAFEALVDVWIDEDVYSPAWDAAMRDWARVSKRAEAAVRRVDARRIELLTSLFRRLAYSQTEAVVRARITYYHQVGYYTLDVIERRADRLKLKPVYLGILLGTDRDEGYYLSRLLAPDPRGSSVRTSTGARRPRNRSVR